MTATMRIGRHDGSPTHRVTALRIPTGDQTFCVGCAEMIFPGEIACEVVLQDRFSTWRALYFHDACYTAWEAKQE